VYGRAADVAALQLDLAGVDRGPDLEADAGRRPTDLLSGMDGSLSAIEPATTFCW